MDFALRELEFPQIIEWIAEYASSELGRAAIHELKPGLDPDRIGEDFELIEEISRMNLPPLSIPLFDFDRLQDRAEVFQVLLFLRILREIKRLPARKGGALDRLLSRIDPLPELRDRLDRIFDDGGGIRDSASPQLSRIRRELRQTHDQIIHLLGRLIRKHRRLLNSDQITTRRGRFVLCVKHGAKDRIRGVVHDLSESGHSLFIEPEESVGIQNQLEELKIVEQREVDRILNRLSRAIAAVSGRLEIDRNILIRLDTIQARARFAREVEGVRPKLNTEGKIRIRSGRHPILYRIKGDGVVPLDLELDSGILVVTGPNAGGKTVLLKTVGLLVAMANAGLFVPAEYGTELPLVDNIFAKIGDEQSLEHDLSSFTVQIEVVKEILSEATPRSLILLDELGSNTSPQEGSALACAILEEIQRIGARCVATTHSEDLKAFVFGRNGFSIGAMGYNGGPTYRFYPNHFTPSCALSIAERMGLSPAIIDRARRLITEERNRFDELTATLAREREELRGRLAEAERLKQSYERRMRELEELRRVKRREYDRKLKQIVQEARREVERLVERLSVEGPKREVIKEIRGRIDRLEPKPEPAPAPDLPIGALVELNGEVGSVLDRKRDEYLVGLGRIRLWIHGSFLKMIDPDPTPTLNLHGRNRDEVSHLIDRFLTDAVNRGKKTVVIIHGLSGGVVKTETDTFLRRDRRVKGFWLDPQNPGQTVVRIYG